MWPFRHDRPGMSNTKVSTLRVRPRISDKDYNERIGPILNEYVDNVLEKAAKQAKNLCIDDSFEFRLENIPRESDDLGYIHYSFLLFATNYGLECDNMNYTSRVVRFVKFDEPYPFLSKEGLEKLMQSETNPAADMSAEEYIALVVETLKSEALDHTEDEFVSHILIYKPNGFKIEDLANDIVKQLRYEEMEASVEGPSHDMIQVRGLGGN